ncbi:unnamed protein product, partial [Porites evermanni]
SLDRNPLDSEFCRNIIESAKRQKSQPVMKKKPITTEIIRSILDIHNKKDANLKNLRIAADILRDTLSQLGLNPNDCGLHSLRSGGITSAVRNSSNSIPERLLKIHGRWKSDSAKDMYVEESLENRLQVTKYLGL